MAASDPAGGQKFWFNGAPFDGVARSGVDTKGLKFWFNGAPVPTLIPTGGAGVAATKRRPILFIANVGRLMN